MPCVIIYTSTQAYPSALDVAQTKRAKGHDLWPLSRLPRPRPVRVATLQLELAALQ